MKISQKNARAYALRLKGQSKKKTIVRQQLQKILSLEGCREDCLNNWNRLLNSRSEKIRLIATKEVSKFLFTQKRELSGTLDVGVTMNIAVTGINEDKLRKLFVEV